MYIRFSAPLPCVTYVILLFRSEQRANRDKCLCEAGMMTRNGFGRSFEINRKDEDGVNAFEDPVFSRGVVTTWLTVGFEHESTVL